MDSVRRAVSASSSPSTPGPAAAAGVGAVAGEEAPSGRAGREASAWLDLALPTAGTAIAADSPSTSTLGLVSLPVDEDADTASSSAV